MSLANSCGPHAFRIVPAPLLAPLPMYWAWPGSAEWKSGLASQNSFLGVEAADGNVVCNRRPQTAFGGL
jgi:hypothetical protein